jgi:putative transposase
MPRIPRIIAEGFPHHIIQRGNRRQKVFFMEKDYLEYLKLLREHSNRNHVAIISYCLMPNHVHIIAIPHTRDGLARAIGETHRKYTRMINFREKWKGYLWQGRFSSYIMDETHLHSAVRYILRNPVKTANNIVNDPAEYKWSSIRHHIGKETIPWLEDAILQEMVDDWREYLAAEVDEKEAVLFRKHERTGRPLGDIAFIEKLEDKLGISLKKKKPGPRGKQGSKYN